MKGNDGQFPEFCVEFPYLERNENTDSLTLAYCVDNEDGTRTELNRVTLKRALMRVMESVADAASGAHLKVMACELRALAARLDEASVPLTVNSRRLLLFTTTLLKASRVGIDVDLAVAGILRAPFI